MNLSKIILLLSLSFASVEGISVGNTDASIYLTTDREIYTVGDDIFFKIYIDALAGTAVDQELCFINVEVVGPDSNSYSKQKIALDRSAGIGDVMVGLNWPTGQYLIRAYPLEVSEQNHHLIFRKSISIYGLATETAAATDLEIEQKTSVRFFPAGGYLVMGLSCRVGVKSEDQFGNAVQVTGWINDSSESDKIWFTTDSLGFAQLQFVPKSAFLTASIIYKKDTISCDLPKPLERGFTCQIVKQDEEEISVQVQSNMPEGLRGAKVSMRQQDQIIDVLALTDDGSGLYLFSSKDLDQGLFCIVLEDSQDRPVSEVLGFHYCEKEEIFLDAIVEGDDRGQGDSLEILLESYNFDGDFKATDLNVSIADKQYFKSTFATDIRTYLLLESELKGPVQNPTIYFTEDREAAREKMNNLLLCQGWRRFTWLAEQIDEVHVAKSCLRIVGRTTLPGNADKGVQARGFVSDLSEDFDFIPFQTDELGYFEMDSLQMYGMRNLFFQTERLSKKMSRKKFENMKLTENRQVSIRVFKDTYVPLIEADFAQFRKTKQRSSEFDYISDNSAVITEAQDSWEGLSLTTDTVEVIAEKINPVVDYYKDGMLYTRPNQRIFIDAVHAPNRYRTIFDLIKAKVTNATITGLAGNSGLHEAQQIDNIKNSGVTGPKVVFRGGSSSLSSATQSNNGASFLINGSMVSSITVENIAPQNVAFIDVIRDLSSLAVYGEAGSGGIIAIYLETGQQIEIAKDEQAGTLHLAFQGYYQARDFFEPLSKTEQGQKRSQSPTLYWNPSIRLKDGTGRLKIPKSSRNGAFVLSIEGMTTDGVPVATRKIINMQ